MEGREGLSPHGRGNPLGRCAPARRCGSIPARAGKPIPFKPGLVVQGVYPRTGGETVVATGFTNSASGLSPHGRGNLLLAQPHNGGTGSIPARAGKPGASCGNRAHLWVYPRTGGETLGANYSGSIWEGLSPHGRGNRAVIPFAYGYTGSIPARAGKPGSRRRGRGYTRVYPRTGGETAFFNVMQREFSGLSPHGRGNLPSSTTRTLRPGSIPARAGKPLPGSLCLFEHGVYPRTGGETRKCALR